MLCSSIFRDHQDQLEMMDHKDQEDQKDHLETKDKLVTKDTLDHQEITVSQEALVSQDPQDHQDLQEICQESWPEKCGIDSMVELKDQAGTENDDQLMTNQTILKIWSTP